MKILAEGAIYFYCFQGKKCIWLCVHKLSIFGLQSLQWNLKKQRSSNDNRVLASIYLYKNSGLRICHSGLSLKMSCDIFNCMLFCSICLF